MNVSPEMNHWSRKFYHAFRGVRIGIQGHSSFRVHFALTLIVFIASMLLRVSLLEWCVLLGCVGTVLMAELMNSALESCAKAITRDYDEHVRDTLDIASGAVLVASIFAAIVGGTIFVFRFGLWMGWWGGYLLI